MTDLQTSTLQLFETTKSERQAFVSDVIAKIDNGLTNPLNVHIQVKCLEDIIKQLTSNQVYKDVVLTEAGKYGKSFEYQNSRIDIREVGVKYDYSRTGDPVIAELLQQQEELEKKIKERQEFLKAIPKEGQQILIDDEVVFLFPPFKTSTTSVSVSLK
jgi:hypothetical protein